MRNGRSSIARAAAATPATIATASPAPSTEPTTPTTAASVSTEARTWAVVEPMVRSSARSRVRWATSTWKVFAMTSAVTSRASAAKPPSTQPSRSVPPLSCVTAERTASSGVATSTSTPAAAASARAASATAGTSAPSARRSSRWGVNPASPSWPCTAVSAAGEAHTCACPESIGSGEGWVRPVTTASTGVVAGAGPDSLASATTSPTATPCRSAVCASRVTPRASSAAGRAPAVTVRPARAGSRGRGITAAPNSASAARAAAHAIRRAYASSTPSRRASGPGSAEVPARSETSSDPPGRTTRSAPA